MYLSALKRMDFIMCILYLIFKKFTTSHSYFYMLGIKAKALCMQGKCSRIKLLFCGESTSKPLFAFLKEIMYHIYL
jgi:hypothetical protein